MAEAEIIGRVLSYPTIYGDAVWEGSDAPVQLRIAARRTSAGAAPTPYVRSDVTQITYSVARKTGEAYQYVTDYVDVEIPKSTAIPADGDNPGDWDFDSHGFNFGHIVPAEALDGPATHLILYRFVLSSGPTTIVQAVEIEVRAPCGTEAAAGGSDAAPAPDPDPVPTPEVDELMFSQTATTSVSNTGAETSLIGSGEGTVTLAADSWEVGEEIVLEASGDYSTKASSPGAVAVLVKVGADLTMTFTLNPLGAQAQSEWRLRVRFTRISSTEIKAAGELYAANATPYPALAGTPSPVSVAASASKQFDVAVDWVTADAGNIWRMRQCSIQTAEVAV